VAVSEVGVIRWVRARGSRGGGAIAWLRGSNGRDLTITHACTFD
jgi:hypothetical protein